MAPRQNDSSGETGARSLRLTAEQEAILAASGSLVIDAVAGSGKTTTLIEYARTRPAGSRILYLAFNKTVKGEAQRRFAAEGMGHVVVETAHSLAYRHVMRQGNYQLKGEGYRAHELVEKLGLQQHFEPGIAQVIANHISRFTAYFCNSSASRVQELSYPSVVGDAAACAFAEQFHAAIEWGTRQLLAKMNSGEWPVTHDFYLKKFQLLSPRLPFDYILFDEGQDASPAMLAVFLQQPAVKVLVGDAHQQIYGWRYAVNAMEGVPFPRYRLSQSFRFNGVIAGLAMEVLGWKGRFKEGGPVEVRGLGKQVPARSLAIVARTNLGLLLRAIEYITAFPADGIYFEGNIHSYTYADEGASLYDVLNLSKGKREAVRDPLLKGMKDLEELEQYIENTGDGQLSMMVEMVRKYGDALPGLLRTLKERHTGDEERHTASMIFSTVHRCKGMEYDAVELAPDFISEARLDRLLAEEGGEDPLQQARWIEEINLLYVALTRTRWRLTLPEVLLPKGFVPSSQVLVIKAGKPATAPEPPLPARRLRPLTGEEERTYREGGRQRGSQSNSAWTAAMDAELRRLYSERVLVRKIAEKLGRTEGAVLLRIRKLELDD
jgi:F-box protein 18 (helicase)